MAEKEKNRKKNKRSLGENLLDLASTIHPSNSPFYTYTTTFPLASFFPTQKTQKFSFFCLKKKIMKNKIVASLACFLPSAYQLLLIFLQNLPQLSLQSLLKPQLEILEGEAVIGNPARFL